MGWLVTTRQNVFIVVYKKYVDGSPCMCPLLYRTKKYKKFFFYYSIDKVFILHKQFTVISIPFSDVSFLRIKKNNKKMKMKYYITLIKK